MKTVMFTVPGQPVGKARPRFVRSTGRVYTPKLTTDYERFVCDCYLDAADGVALDGPIEATLTAFYQIPASASKKRRERMLRGEEVPEKKPDADNVAKAILDALNGIAYNDDSSVCRLVVEKRYADVARVEITLRKMI